MRATIKARVRKLEAAEQETERPSVAELLGQARKERAKQVSDAWWSPAEIADMKAKGGWQARIAAARRRAAAGFGQSLTL
jgi:hypothetical protein